MLNKKHPQPNTLSQWRTGRGHRLYFSAVLMLTLCAALACPALAADTDPLTIVNNLSDFIFSCIKAVGVIVLGWGIVQLGMSIQSHDASQRTQGILCVWNAIVGINEGLKAVGYGLLVLFFAMGIFQSAASFRDLQRPEYALRHFIRFIAAKVAVSSAMEIMTVVFSICGGIVQSVMSGMGGMVAAGVTVPQEMVDAIENVGFLASIPLWLVAMLGNLFITVMSFILIMTVYGRFFRLYIFTALAPIPLATFAGEGTSFAGKQFIKSYIGVCMEGAVIVLACLIFSAFMSSGSPVLDTNLTPVVMAWQYIAETIFNMLVLVGLVKGAERIVRELFGL